MQHDLTPSADGAPPSKRPRYGVAPPRRHVEVGFMRSGRDASSFVGSASGIYFARSVHDALQDSLGADTIPGEDDRLPDATQQAAIAADLWDKSEVKDEAEITSLTLQQLSNDYFDHWHVMLPFLYAPNVLRAFERIAQAPLSQASQSVDHLDLTITRAILSISAADRRQCGQSRSSPVPSALVFHTHQQAIESLQLCLTLPASCRSLQAVLAVQLFLISMLRFSAATRVSGLAMRLAYQLGLHRCPYRYAIITDEHEAQMRKRIFWSIYCMDRILCQSLGLPLGVRDDDIDVCLFAKEKHRDTQTWLDPRMAQLHFLVKHAEMKGMIVEYCNKNIDHRPADIRIRQGIEESMARYANERDDFFELNSESLFVHKAQQFAILVLQHECVIALYRPLLALPRDSAEYTAALQTCISAARSSINMLHSTLLAHLSKYASYDHEKVLTPLFWPSFTWLTWMSAFIILYAATNDELQIEVAEQLIKKGIEILEHLSLRGTVWPQKCTVAIRQLLVKLNATRPQHTKQKSSHVGLSGYQIGTGTSPTTPNEQLPVLNESYMFSLPEDAMTDGNFARRMPSGADVLAAPDGVGLFDGFDIPFWLGDDQLFTDIPSA